MKTKLAALISAGIAGLAITSTPTTASAEEVARYQFAQLGDAADCIRLGVGSDPCARVRWTYYIYPNLMRELNRAINIKDGPDPVPWEEVGFAGFGGELGKPNPLDPDNPWGPLGPLVQEALAVENHISTGIAEPVGYANKKFENDFFETGATLEDLNHLRGGLKQVLTQLDESISAIEAGK